LHTAAKSAEAVIHTAFIHDFSKFRENCETDRKVITALGDALAGSDRLLIVTSGTAIARVGSGVPATENDSPVSSDVIPRGATEEAVASLAAQGVRVATIRLPQVHDTRKQGLVTYAIDLARQKGVSAYVGNGDNRWPAAPRLTTAHLYRLALEKGDAHVRYHAVAEEGVPVRDIAATIGRGLNVPVVSVALEEAAEHFGWLAMFAAMDIPASSLQTRETLGWKPTGPSLLSDLQNMRY
jgi:nucleoside-diphosphate-sugar epimerase